MRIVRLKLDKDVKAYLRQYAKQFVVDDAGFVEDLFSLFRLKGSGLPTKERIVKMAKAAAKRRKGQVSEISVNMLITKRKMMFSAFIGTPYFHTLLALKDPMDSVSRFLVNMRKLYLKTRQAQCLSCAFVKQCDFGKQYSAYYTDITKVIDPNFAKKVHKDCPVMPEIDGFNQYAAACKQMAQIAAQNSAQAAVVNSVKGANTQDLEQQQEDLEDAAPDIIEDEATDNVGGGEDEADFYIPTGSAPRSAIGGVFDGRLDGNQLCKVSEKLIDDLSIQQLMIFELGKKFSQELTAQKVGKFKPVPQVEHDKTSVKIENESELPKVIPSQQGLPDEVFDARLEKKELRKTQYSKPEDKKKLLYLLIDVSGSMLSVLGDGSKAQHGVFQRITLATLFAVACTKRVRDDKGIVYVRCFASAPTDMKSARTPDEYEALINWLSLPSARGGGTSITTVVKMAAEDIKESKDDLHSAEILLITDCEDSFTAAGLKTLLGKTELNTLDVAGGSMKGWAAAELKALSTKYYKANEAEPDITKIVSLV